MVPLSRCRGEGHQSKAWAPTTTTRFARNSEPRAILTLAAFRRKAQERTAAPRLRKRAGTLRLNGGFAAPVSVCNNTVLEGTIERAGDAWFLSNLNRGAKNQGQVQLDRAFWQRHSM